MIDLKIRLYIALTLTLSTLVGALVCYLTGLETGAVYFGGAATICIAAMWDMLRAHTARNGNRKSDSIPEPAPVPKEAKGDSRP